MMREHPTNITEQRTEISRSIIFARYPRARQAALGHVAGMDLSMAASAFSISDDKGSLHKPKTRRKEGQARPEHRVVRVRSSGFRDLTAP